ncbi:MAG: xanthine dehydrogenase family protein molybdopterin-binding subunit [Acidobacteriota bacterium]|nr:xanthine dehydrogenase family protein molybdopterin-binding subunit [Acidobacteriota bacterium]
MVEAAAVEPHGVVGAALPRIDGPAKTTGTASYAADYNLPGLAFAVPVTSTIARGRIRRIDAATAEAMPGVLLVLHHGNIGPLYRMPQAARVGRTSENRTPLEDDVISYWGQYVAVVVANTFQQAQAAAARVRVEYEAAPANVSMDLSDPLPALGAPGGPHVESQRGDAATAFSAAPITVDETYTTPAETHNPMEMHATVAHWDGSKFTLYESSQGVMNHLNVMAQTLGVPKENIQVISRYIGSGFGGKLFPWPHSALAAVASRRLNRPVKFTVPRKQMFTAVGHRPRTQQRIRLGANAQGRLVSLEQHYRNHTSQLDDIRENCGEATPFLYSVPNLQVTSALVRRNVGTPAPMRGPGAVPGLFALESAIDELAIKLKKDPVAFRIEHDTLIDESNKKPFSSRHLKECLQTGAEKFGWSRRTPEVGSMRRGDAILGWGVAAASWGAGRGGSEATVILNSDGTIRVSSGTQDIGTGTYTIIAQAVSDKTGVPIQKIDVVLGDSSLVPGPTSGGSTATATVLPSVADGVNQAVRSLLATAARTSGSRYFNQDPAGLRLSAGRVHAQGESPEAGVPFAEVLQQASLAFLRGDGKSGGHGSDTHAPDYSMHSFGAQFVEVEWRPAMARLRVSRVETVIDAGRIINPRTASNQISGGVVMGVGMALFEETYYEPRDGHPANASFADYLVPVHADAPSINVSFLNIPDPLMGEYGARGVGEIGLAGVAPAITAAVYHATGVRVRNLPVRIEDLLTSRVV